MQICVLVPTFNEVANVSLLLNAIEKVTRTIPDATFRVTIIDDSSPDGTAAVVERLRGELNREGFLIDVLRKHERAGLGAAYQYGYQHVIPAQNPDFVIQMDADLSHNPVYLAGFAEQARADVDLVVASRYIPGGGTPDWGARRRFLSRGGNTYARMMLGRKVTDYTGAYMMMSKWLIDQVHVETIGATGYGFMLVLKARAAQAARTSIELPIVFLDREHGQSKLPRNTLWTNFRLVARMRFFGAEK